MGPGDGSVQGYCRVFDGLWTLLEVPTQDPQVVAFTRSGRQTFVECANALYVELTDPDCPEMMRGPLAKLEGYGARFALLLQLCRCVCGDAHGEHVDEGSVLGAAALVDYFKSHARRVYSRALDMMSVKAMPGLLRQLERLKALIWVRLMTVPASGTWEPSPPDRLLDETLETARRIADNAPISVRQAKHAIHYGLQMDLGSAMMFEIEAYNRMVPTEDRREGIASFNEKRKPRFRGR